MRWSFWPVSITAHILLGITVFIAPLLAEVQPPVPAPLHTPFAATKTVPIPPDVAASAPAVRETHVAPSVEAPFTLEPERETPPASGGLIIPGLPPGSGTIDPSMLGGPATGISPIDPPPPPPAPAQTILRVGQGIREPKRIAGVAPDYPKFAKDARVQGIVILETVINERGEVGRVKVLRSVPLLDNAAITAVQQWRYTPTLLNGVPVSVLMTITINFKLQD